MSAAQALAALPPHIVQLYSAEDPDNRLRLACARGNVEEIWQELTGAINLLTDAAGVSKRASTRRRILDLVALLGRSRVEIENLANDVLGEPWEYFDTPVRLFAK